MQELKKSSTSKHKHGTNIRIICSCSIICIATGWTNLFSSVYGWRSWSTEESVIWALGSLGSKVTTKFTRFNLLFRNWQKIRSMDRERKNCREALAYSDFRKDSPACTETLITNDQWNWRDQSQVDSGRNLVLWSGDKRSRAAPCVCLAVSESAWFYALVHLLGSCCSAALVSLWS